MFKTALKQNSGFTPSVIARSLRRGNLVTDRLLRLPRNDGQERKAFDTCLVRGFTMIELLISIAVFSIIVATASGVFITSLRSNRASIALISANSNGQMALEQMARMIRKGKNFNSDLTNPEYKCLGFAYGGSLITYRWNNCNNCKGKKSLEWNIVDEDKSSPDCSNDLAFTGIISDSLRVDFADFKIISQGAHPFITIILRVGARNILVSSGQSFINLQTSVSPRNDNRY